MNKIKIIIITTVILIISVFSIYNFFDILKNEHTEIVYSDIISENVIEKEKIDNKEEKNNIKIHICGEINNQGIIELEEGERISDAIDKAGGLSLNADLSKVNLAYVLQDGQKLYIPSLEDSKDIEYISEDSENSIIEDFEKKNVNIKNGKINLNKASKTDLESIPGVGPSLAQKIISYREENGKFNNIEDLKNVNGIGDKKLDNLKEYVQVK